MSHRKISERGNGQSQFSRLHCVHFLRIEVLTPGQASSPCPTEGTQNKVAKVSFGHLMFCTSCQSQNGKAQTNLKGQRDQEEYEG